MLAAFARNRLRRFTVAEPLRRRMIGSVAPSAPLAGSDAVRSIIELRQDIGGRAGVNFVVAVALIAMPVLYPKRTLGVLRDAQSSWEHIWTIDGLRGQSA